MKINSRLFQTTILAIGFLFIGACAPMVTQNPVKPATSTQIPTTMVLKSSSPTLTMVPTETPETVKTSTAVPSPTPPADVILKPNGKTNCRALPYATSRVIGYLRIGAEASAVGKDARGEWYLILNPDKKDGTYCWVFSTAVQTTGDPALLPFKSAVQK